MMLINSTIASDVFILFMLRRPVVDRTELSMPPTIKLDQAVGFNLWALKAVLKGRGDEVVDPAVPNIIR